MPALVTTQHSDGVAELVLDSPPVNALSVALVADLNLAIDLIPPETRAIAVTSAVDGVFIAGGDIRFMLEEPMERLEQYVVSLQETFTRLETWPGPVIAAIDGACLGGGLELALTCDIRIVSAGSQLGSPEVGLGIIAGAGGTQRMVRTIGQGAARDLLLTGRRLSGREALTIRLATHLVEGGRVRSTALDLAAELANGASEAIQATKRLTMSAPDTTLDEGLAREREEWKRVRESANAQEGLTAFLERRPPRFG